MNPSPFLRHIMLSECFVRSEPRERVQMPLGLNVDIEEIRFEDADEDWTIVTIELALELHDEAAEPQADLAAEFRLHYQGAELATLEDRRSFAVNRALGDVWPVWRAWAHSTLSRMDLPPTPIPAQVPHQMVGQGGEAFDLSRQVDEALAVPAEAPSHRFWETLEKDLEITPIERWEFVASRSGYSSHCIYKLYLRPEGSKGRWWSFEESIGRVSAKYPGSHADLNVFRGSSNLLELLDIDEADRWRDALVKALGIVHTRLRGARSNAARPEVR